METAAVTEEKYAPSDHASQGAHITSLEQYEAMYKESITDPDAFWGRIATETLTFFSPWTAVSQGSFVKGDVAWFVNAQLNVCYNCVDRHLPRLADKAALIWEGNELGKEQRVITYQELHTMVCLMGNVLRAAGVRKGDCVAIYLPMIPEAAAAMLACARIGAPHTVIFAGFSSTAIRDRLEDSKARVIITADEGVRGPKVIPLKAMVDEAVRGLDSLKKVLVVKRTGGRVHWHPERDAWMEEEMARHRPVCPVERMDAEDALFLLYTSGSTGKPKGILHTQAGYLLQVAYTHKMVFDVRETDVYACVADVGWITGHSYIVYGPLCNGATSVMFEPTPLYPDAGRYWAMVERLKVTSFYTAPTAIRALMKFDAAQFVDRYDLSSLRVIGSVGEPINPASWLWYNKHVGRGRCAIVDTYWQTESGGHLITSLPGATPTKPGCATLPFFGIEPVLLDPLSGKELPADAPRPKVGVLAIKRPWPGIGRTVYGDHQRYLTTYMHVYPGYYFTGDGATIDKDDYIWITGRVDDVCNVSGHRIGTAELESALVNHPLCPEAAVIAIPHEIKGQCLYAFCVLRDGHEATPALRAELSQQVANEVGSFARPEAIVLVSGLPKTRSGKIMRRLLRKIAERNFDQLGDVTTLAEPQILESIIQAVKDLEGPQLTRGSTLGL